MLMPGVIDLTQLDQFAHKIFGKDLKWPIVPTTATPGAGYKTPPSWTASSMRNTDPINVIISGNSTVSIGEILRWLQGDGYDVPVVGFVQGMYFEVGNGGGTSIENFNSGDGSVGQDYSWRQGGLATELDFIGSYNHVRALQQSETGAWFISASYEGLVPSEPLVHGSNCQPVA
jgi:hypothetical protein